MLSARTLADGGRPDRDRAARSGHRRRLRRACARRRCFLREADHGFHQSGHHRQDVPDSQNPRGRAGRAFANVDCPLTSWCTMSSRSFREFIVPRGIAVLVGGPTVAERPPDASQGDWKNRYFASSHAARRRGDAPPAASTAARSMSPTRRRWRPPSVGPAQAAAKAPIRKSASSLWLKTARMSCSEPRWRPARSARSR
jgi:hypothetical protein